MIIIGLLQRVFALASLAILAGGGYLVWSWFELRDEIREVAPGVEATPDDWRLWVGGAMLAWSFLGRFLVLPLVGRGGGLKNRLKRGASERMALADGTELHLEHDGREDGPALVLVHGWGMDATFWREARDQLGDRFHLVMFDLPGLGRSKLARDKQVSIDRYADQLGEVVERLAPRQVVLVGHSIGGMIVQTFARRRPDLLNSRVAGLVLENTTHTDPTRTMLFAKVIHALEPLWRVLMRVDIALSPLLHLMNWQSYLSGHMQLAMRIGGFGDHPTRSQVDQTALLSTKASPAVKAKGNLAMMSWGVTDDLPRVSVPALVLAGGRDIVTKEEASETIAGTMPQARLLRVLDAGHMGPLERAQDYNRAIAAFAQEVFAGQARSDMVRAGEGAFESRAPREPQSFQPRPSL